MANDLTDEEAQDLLQQFIEGGSLNPDDVQGGFEKPNNGEYDLQLIDVDVKEVGPNKRPSLVARFELKKARQTQNEGCVGMDVAAFFSLVIKPPKKKGGKPYAPGYKEAYDMMAAANGGKAPTERPKVVASSDGNALIDGQQFKKIFAKAVGKKRLHGVILENKYTDRVTKEEKSTQKVRIVGLSSSGGAVQAVADSSESEAADDFA